MALTGAGALAARQSCLSEDEALQYVSSSESNEPDLALQGHLDSCNPCRMMIAEATRAMGDSGLASSRTAEIPQAPVALVRPGSPTSLAIGEVLLGRYTIVGFVARGGMGEVYEAYDAALQETVALKTLVCTDLDRPAAVLRLMAEVRLARQVTHPNVCRIYEFGMHQPEGRHGRDAEPIPFLTMEFLRGETLDRRLARLGRFEPEEVLRLLPQMTAGLGAIHAAEIIHRDIKPGNISLLPGPPERLVLMDLGLARAADPEEHGPSLSAGRLVGTLDYMAPEQLRGLPATGRIDIYALGLVMFEMLTGRRPFPRKDALSSAVERVIRPTPRPSQVVADLDPAWDTLMGRCLAPDPERRFASVEELNAFVRDHGRSAPVPNALDGGGRGQGFGASAPGAGGPFGAGHQRRGGAAGLGRRIPANRDRRSDRRGRRKDPGRYGTLAPYTSARISCPAIPRPRTSARRTWSVSPTGSASIATRHRSSTTSISGPPRRITRPAATWSTRCWTTGSARSKAAPADCRYRCRSCPPGSGRSAGGPGRCHNPRWCRRVSPARSSPRSPATAPASVCAPPMNGARPAGARREPGFPTATATRRASATSTAATPRKMLSVDITDGLLDPRMNLVTFEDTGPRAATDRRHPELRQPLGRRRRLRHGRQPGRVDGRSQRRLDGGLLSPGRPRTAATTPTPATRPYYFDYSHGFRCCDRLR